MSTWQPLMVDGAAAQGESSSEGTLPGGARSCREPVGVGCAHPNRATACEGESKEWINFHCPATREGLLVPFKVGSALEQTFTPLPLLPVPRGHSSIATSQI